MQFYQSLTPPMTHDICRHMLNLTTLVLLAVLGFSATSDAQTRFWHLDSSSILASTYQATPGVRKSYNTQLDMLGYIDTGPGYLQYEIKAGTTPLNNGISQKFPEANALAGETLSSQGYSRLALTQFYYARPFGQNKINAGLIFPANYIDTNPVANDEYHQFLGTTFVNNPTINMPVYVLGGAYSHSFKSDFTLISILTSSRDLYGHRYPHLLDSQANDRGAFGDIEFKWRAHNHILMGNLGAWFNTAHNITTPPVTASTTLPLSIAITSHHAYGLYANFGGKLPVTSSRWDIRVGWANPKASLANNFISIQAKKTLRSIHLMGHQQSVTVAAGLSRTGPSYEAIGPADATIQAELYARTQIINSLFISPDIQWIEHSNFNPDQHGQWIEGLRLGIEL